MFTTTTIAAIAIIVVLVLAGLAYWLATFTIEEVNAEDVAPEIREVIVREAEVDRLQLELDLAIEMETSAEYINELSGQLETAKLAVASARQAAFPPDPAEEETLAREPAPEVFSPELSSPSQVVWLRLLQ